MDGRGGGVRITVAEDFSPLHDVQTGSGAQPASYPVSTGSSFPGGKAAGRETDLSPQATAEVKNMSIYISAPPYSFMA
jgi:hypothetical protein